MRIPEHTIQEIKEQTDIMDVISKYMTIKKRGNSWKGSCPFHNEKTASFSVHPGKQIFKCFGCDEGGDVFTFVSKIDGLSWIESVRSLADQAGIELPKKKKSETPPKFDVFRFTAAWFHDQLSHSSENIPFSDEIIKHYSLGIVREVDGLKKELESKTDEENLKASGLFSGAYDEILTEQSDHPWLVFPVKTHYGRHLTIAFFNYRRLEWKFVRPDSGFSPIITLLGLNSAKNSIRTPQKVDEFWDAKKTIARISFTPTDLLTNFDRSQVATLFTPFTPDQAAILSKFADLVEFRITDIAPQFLVSSIKAALSNNLSVTITQPNQQPVDWMNWLSTQDKTDKSKHIFSCIASIPDELTQILYINDFSKLQS